jgi:uncharacterized sodium:solute symporter family permease YidK
MEISHHKYTEQGYLLIPNFFEQSYTEKIREIISMLFSNIQKSLEDF